MPEITEEQRKALEEKLKKMSPEELKEFQKQQCVFCQIVQERVPAKTVYSDEKCLAVMDINPAAPGHVLLFPKEHYAIMPQIPDEEIGHLFMVAKHLSQAVLRKLKVDGVNIFVANGAIAGQRAQHFMIHVIPRKDGDGVLEVPEHLVDEDSRGKLGVMLGNGLNKILGIKKERVMVKEKEEEKELKGAEREEGKEEGKIVEAEFEEKEEKKKKGRKKRKEKESEEDNDTEDAEEGREGEDRKGEDREGDDEEKEKDDEETEADLDDIANLFK